MVLMLLFISSPDNEPPQISGCPLEISRQTDAGNDTALITWNLTVTDNADPNPVVKCSPEPGSEFNEGVTAVVCEALDENGNRAATCEFEVDVELGE